MKPIMLKGHERAITCVIYNREGDLVFTSSKDHHPNLWLATTGERIGSCTCIRHHSTPPPRAPSNSPSPAPQTTGTAAPCGSSTARGIP